LLAEDAPTVKHVRKTRVAAKAKAPKTKRVKRAKKGKMSDSIISFLAGKGKTGAHIKDIAAGVGTKPANITAWFYSPTGKRVLKSKALKKVGPATFAFVDKGE
jgi:hypothetical protein